MQQSRLLVNPKAVPFGCASTAFVAQDTAVALRFHRLRGYWETAFPCGPFSGDLETKLPWLFHAQGKTPWRTDVQT